MPGIYGGKVAEAFFLGFVDLLGTLKPDPPRGAFTEWPPDQIFLIAITIQRWFETHRFRPLSERNVP